MIYISLNQRHYYHSLNLRYGPMKISYKVKGIAPTFTPGFKLRLNLSSMTGWLDYLFNIWPFEAMNNSSKQRGAR